MFWIILIINVVLLIITIKYNLKILNIFLIFCIMILAIDDVTYISYLKSQYQDCTEKLVSVENRISNFDKYYDEYEFTYAEMETYSDLVNEELTLENNKDKLIAKYKLWTLMNFSDETLH